MKWNNPSCNTVPSPLSFSSLLFCFLLYALFSLLFFLSSLFSFLFLFYASLFSSQIFLFSSALLCSFLSIFTFIRDSAWFHLNVFIGTPLCCLAELLVITLSLQIINIFSSLLFSLPSLSCLFPFFIVISSSSFPFSFAPSPRAFTSLFTFIKIKENSTWAKHIIFLVGVVINVPSPSFLFSFFLFLSLNLSSL